MNPTQLAFSLPAAAFDPIGRTLLTSSVRPTSAGSASGDGIDRRHRAR